MNKHPTCIPSFSWSWNSPIMCLYRAWHTSCIHGSCTATEFRWQTQTKLFELIILCSKTKGINNDHEQQQSCTQLENKTAPDSDQHVSGITKQISQSSSSSVSAANTLDCVLPDCDIWVEAVVDWEKPKNTDLNWKHKKSQSVKIVC